MAEPVWISEAVVQGIHQRQLAEHGGAAGVRDAGLLSSALARPRHRLAYSSDPPDLAVLAAAYAFALAKNHAFFDANKRTAAVVCETFIELNGHKLVASDEEMYLIIPRTCRGNRLGRQAGGLDPRSPSHR